MTALFAATAAAASGPVWSVRTRRTRPARADGWPPPTAARTASARDYSGLYDRQPRLGRWLARAGARPAPGRQAGPSGCYGPAGRRPQPAVLGGLSAVVDDRPHRNVLTSRAASAGAAASRPPQPGGRTSVSGMAPYRCASSGKCRAYPLSLIWHAGDPRPHISRDTRCRDPPGTAAALLAARGTRANRRTMPPAPARSIRAQ